MSLSILKWMALAVLPILAVVGGWNLLSRDKTPTPGAGWTDDPAIVVPSESAPPSPTPGASASASPGAKPSNKPNAQILNGTGSSRSLTSAETKLKGAGYSITTTSEASRRYTKSTVFYQEGFAAQAKELAALMSVSAADTLTAPENLDKQIPLAFVIGADYKP
ncbi:MAG: LytR C-terminal domain-containing protein [Actinomycetota bacterium]